VIGEHGIEHGPQRVVVRPVLGRDDRRFVLRHVPLGRRDPVPRFAEELRALGGVRRRRRKHFGHRRPVEAVARSHRELDAAGIDHVQQFGAFRGRVEFPQRHHPDHGRHRQHRPEASQDLPPKPKAPHPVHARASHGPIRVEYPLPVIRRSSHPGAERVG